MPKLTAIQAAHAGYAGRAAIYAKLKVRLMNAETDDDGTTIISPAELSHVLREPKPPRKTSREAN